MVSELLSLRADMKREEAGDLTEPFRLESQVRTSACLNEQVRNREINLLVLCATSPVLSGHRRRMPARACFCVDVGAPLCEHAAAVGPPLLRKGPAKGPGKKGRESRGEERE